MKSLYQEHCDKWAKGCGSDQCQGSRVVFARGDIPCDILFTGEAPGQSEDVLGRPFVGPAGKLIDSIIMRSVGEENQHRAADGRLGLSWAFTNMVCCLPREPDGDKATEPYDEQIKACMPRLQEFVRIADPRLLVCVGKVANDWTDTRYRHSVKFHREIPKVTVTHPAAILRMPYAQRGMAIQRCIVTIANAVQELLT